VTSPDNPSAESRQARRLSPAELARQDQHVAAADDLAREHPDAMHLVTTYEPPGKQCCWNGRHDDPQSCCCHNEARYRYRVTRNGEERTTAICEQHRDDFQKMIIDTAADAGTNINYHSVNILDGGASVTDQPPTPATHTHPDTPSPNPAQSQTSRNNKINARNTHTTRACACSPRVQLKSG
jgi:hypothetical protein